MRYLNAEWILADVFRWHRKRSSVANAGSNRCPLPNECRSAALRRRWRFERIRCFRSSSRLVEAVEVLPSTVPPEFVIDRQPYTDERAVAQMAFDPTRTELYLYDVVRGSAAAGVEAVILPCFLCHAFIEELQGQSVRGGSHASRREFPDARRIGVVTSDFVRAQRLFERSLAVDSGRLVYPDDDVQRDCVMPAIQGRDDKGDLLAKACEKPDGAGRRCDRAGSHRNGGPRQRVASAVDGFADRRPSRWPPNKDVRLHPRLEKPFKIGVVGGVGPAATVDGMSKIVVNTPARKDQEHIKVVVEENPQIPDRTDNSLNGGRDPTIALYATCKRLEEDEASVIAIPCNTVHAYIARIQSLLSIPIVNMLHETMAYIADHYPAQKKRSACWRPPAQSARASITRPHKSSAAN